MTIVIDKRMKSKVESMHLHEQGVCSIRFTDLMDTFWFNCEAELQEFLNAMVVERYYHKELRRGYLSYKDEYGAEIQYYVVNNRGTLSVIDEIIA